MNARCVLCKNPGCEQPIPLLCSNLLGIDWFGTEERQGEPHEILLCPYCDHVYDYTQSDPLILDVSQVPALAQSRELSLGIIEFDCSVEKCGIRVLILRPIPVERPISEIGKSASEWTFASAHCKNDHAIRVLPPDWWSSYAAINRQPL